VWVQAEWEIIEQQEQQESVATDKQQSWSALARRAISVIDGCGSSDVVAESEEV
jgi:hypothetical protein